VWYCALLSSGASKRFSRSLGEAHRYVLSEMTLDRGRRAITGTGAANEYFAEQIVVPQSKLP